jgi:hypothetical protein
MNQPSDVWYIRLPDGRVLRAGSTAAVRHHLEQGDVPLDSRVRRSPLDGWAALETVAEFADLATFALGRSRRPNGQRGAARGPSDAAGRGGMALQDVGVGGLVTELTTALDSTLVRGKLLTAAATGLVAGVVVAVGRLLPAVVDVPSPPLLWAGLGLVLLVVAAWCTAVLGGLTYVELAHARPARWREATAGLGRNVARLTVCYLVVVGGVLLVLAGLRWLPGWLVRQGQPDGVAAAATVVRLVLEVALWPLLGFSLLLAPAVIVECCSAAAALRAWCGLLREHLGRVFLYEALAAAVAAVAALPFVVPVELAARSVPPGEVSAAAAETTVWVLRGLALTPAIAYLAVANVFIYVTLRYGTTSVSS